MRKSKVVLIKEINDIVATLKPHLVALKVREDAFDLPDCEIPYDKLKEGHAWMVIINFTVLKDMLDIWKLLPEERWKRYFLWGDFEEHREMVLLRQKRFALRSVLISRHRADLFKKGCQDEWRAKSKSHNHAGKEDCMVGTTSGETGSGDGTPVSDSRVNG